MQVKPIYLAHKSVWKPNQIDLIGQIKLKVRNLWALTRLYQQDASQTVLTLWNLQLKMGINFN